MDDDPLLEEVRRCVAECWRPEATVRSWWAALADRGLAQPAWPVPFGRGVAPARARAVVAELAAHGVVAPPTGVIGVGMAAPTLLAHATPDQLERFLPPLLRGEESWCQLFSEPGAGSDLPALAARAEPVPGGWLVTGQKVWNTGADLARRGLLLARTDPTAPKREGISYFVLDLDQPGVEVRPLVTMNGQAHFCEVFLTEAFVAEDDLLGPLHGGWAVARTTLAAERASAADRPARGLVSVASGAAAGQLDRSIGEVLAGRTARPARFSGSGIRSAELVAIARERGRTDDPVVRQALARHHTLTTVHRWNGQRARAAGRGELAARLSSFSKLNLAEICTLSRDLAFELLGAHALLGGADAPFGGELHAVALSSPGVRIGAGTDEIQRTTVGERVLGLPREPTGG